MLSMSMRNKKHRYGLVCLVLCPWLRGEILSLLVFFTRANTCVFSPFYYHVWTIFVGGLIDQSIFLSSCLIVQGEWPLSVGGAHGWHALSLIKQTAADQWWLAGTGCGAGSCRGTWGQPSVAAMACWLGSSSVGDRHRVFHQRSVQSI